MKYTLRHWRLRFFCFAYEEFKQTFYLFTWIYSRKLNEHERKRNFYITYIFMFQDIPFMSPTCTLNWWSLILHVWRFLICPYLLTKKQKRIETNFFPSSLDIYTK